MHLRSLRLRGFKSFPDTLELKLEPGVAVVVGPNGSGKSNVADAIVWAAGSLTPSELRAEKPDDVLFNGAEGRTPAESCEVELVFDNESGDFGELDFSEVSIARRLHRGGEGQYLVNKAQVRRTDLVELLADVGLSGSMHSIVSQGKVEAVLASKPEERRELVEEAAGLGKFKRRRHRAELKLARVGIQVERARDVEAEVRKRLRPLALQATAAERAERLVDEIAGLRARIAQLDLDAADARREAAEERKTAAVIGRRSAQEKLKRCSPRGRRPRKSSRTRPEGARQRSGALPAAGRHRTDRAQAGGRRRAAPAPACRPRRRPGRREPHPPTVDGRARAGSRRGDRSRARRSRRERSWSRARSCRAGAPRFSGTGRRDRGRGTARGARRRASGDRVRVGRRRRRPRGSHVCALQARHRARADRDAGRVRIEPARALPGRAGRGRVRGEAARPVPAELEAAANEATAAARAAAHARDDVAERAALAKDRLGALERSLAEREGIPPAARAFADEGARLALSLLEVEAGSERAVAAALGWRASAVLADDPASGLALLQRARDAGLGSLAVLVGRPRPIASQSCRSSVSTRCSPHASPR